MDYPGILRQINQEVQDFKTKQIQIVPGYSFNQPDNINKIFFYYNSKFQTGEIDDEGDKKYFYNINRNPCKIFRKAVDFDTKNIRLLTTGGGNPTKTWFMERDLKFWMRDIQFGKVLNRIFTELPIYGSVVIKIIDGRPYFVDLRNFIVQQGSDDLKSMNYIIEIHNFTPVSFRKAGERMGWDKDKIEEAIKLFHQMKGVSHIRVYERYGEVCEEKNGKKTYPFKRVFIADVGLDEYDKNTDQTISHKGIELSCVDWKDPIPYWEFHKDKIPGRWQGVGVVEELFEPQIKQNEIANLQSKGAQWAAIRLFFSRDTNHAGNLMTDKRNGDVLIGESEITQIDMSDRNLAFFNEETRKWQNNRDELVFSYDAIQGERSPAGTPLGSTQISIGQTLSYFEGIQEEIAMDIKEMLYQVIIPQFEKESTEEHTLRLVGQDLEQFTNFVKNELVLKEISRFAMNKGRLPNPDEKDVIELAITESFKQNKEHILTIPKGAYKDAKYDVDIDITGESVDTRVRYATRFAILQAITADPTITQDPVKKKILQGIAEDGGLNPTDIWSDEVPTIQNIPSPLGRAGGGVSAPAMNSSIPGQSNQTL